MTLNIEQLVTLSDLKSKCECKWLLWVYINPATRRVGAGVHITTQAYQSCSSNINQGAHAEVSQRPLCVCFFFCSKLLDGIRWAQCVMLVGWWSAPSHGSGASVRYGRSSVVTFCLAPHSEVPVSPSIFLCHQQFYLRHCHQYCFHSVRLPAFTTSVSWLSRLNKKQMAHSGSELRNYHKPQCSSNEILGNNLLTL